VTSASLQATVDVMRKRLAQFGVQAEVKPTAADAITVALANVSNTPFPQEQVRRTAQLYFYDWEPNVIGPTGQPAPTDGTVTGDSTAAGPGGVTAGLPEYRAVQRAFKRAPIFRSADTTWTNGCTPQQVSECNYGSWYLLDTRHEKVLRGPEETAGNLYAEGYKPPAGAVSLRVYPGTVVVQARPVESASGKISNPSPNSWYVMNDEPVLTGADITHPQQGFEEGAGGNGQPNVNFGFTAHGKSVFEAVTKKIAHRGQEAQLPGVSKEAAEQHFAVVLDGQLVTTPSIDYTKYPEGIDATSGSQISGGFTITSAQNLANELRVGAPPLRLVLISRSRVPAGQP
jgi:SecD/SecF fusion protein